MLKTCNLSKHSGLHTKMCKSSTDCTVNTDRCLNRYCFYYFQGLLSISRGWKPAVIPERPASPPTGLPQQQHPATEPEEEHEEEESPHPRQLDHHPGAAGSRLEVAGREEDLQPSAVCDHGVIWGQRGGGRREKREESDDTNWKNKTMNASDSCELEGGWNLLMTEGTTLEKREHFDVMCLKLSPERTLIVSTSRMTRRNDGLWGKKSAAGTENIWNNPGNLKKPETPHVLFFCNQMVPLFNSSAGTALGPDQEVYNVKETLYVPGFQPLLGTTFPQM